MVRLHAFPSLKSWMSDLLPTATGNGTPPEEETNNIDLDHSMGVQWTTLHYLGIPIAHPDRMVLGEREREKTKTKIKQII